MFASLMVLLDVCAQIVPTFEPDMPQNRGLVMKNYTDGDLLCGVLVNATVALLRYLLLVRGLVMN